MGQIYVQAFEPMVNALQRLNSPGKHRFLHRIPAFCGIFPAFLAKFWTPVPILLKSAIIYPSVAIPVHFR
jgi:hypothetical protein